MWRKVKELVGEKVMKSTVMEQVLGEGLLFCGRIASTFERR